MNKTFLISLLATFLLTSAPPIHAQQPGKVPRIGYLTGTSAPTIATPDLNADAFRQGLRDLGYIEGKNIQVEYRYAEAREDRVIK